MFATLGQFVTKVANLAEAEGRVAIRQLLLLAMVVVLLTAAGALGIGAVAVLAAAAYVALVPCVHPAVALLASALVLLITAAVVGWIARALWLDHSPKRKRTDRNET